MDSWHYLTGHFNYIVVIILMMTGLYIVISTGNLVKKLVGLGVFQTSVFQLYITMGKIHGGTPPILQSAHEGSEAHGAVIRNAPVPIAQSLADVPIDGVIYSNPVPHVLILTAIVVGVATLAVGLALVVRIQESYGSVEEDDLREADYQSAAEPAK